MLKAYNYIGNKGIRSLSYKTSTEVEYNGQTQYRRNLALITVNGDEYLVGTSSNAESAAQMSARDSYADGIFNQSFVLNFINGEDFAVSQVGDDEYYDEEVERHPDRYIRNAPEGEDDTYTEEQIYEAIQKLKQEKRDDIASDPFGYLHSMGYNDREAMEQLSRYVNEDELVEDAVNTEGVAHFLSTYDGNEYSSDDLNVDPEYFPEDLKDFLGERAVVRDDLCYFKVG